MSKSLRNDRRFADEYEYEYEDNRVSRKEKKLRRKDKRRELPCERED